MTAALEIAGVAKHYGQGDGLVRALDGVSLRVDHGEMVAIMGTSGSGKSTLLTIAGGLTKPTEGTVRVDGMELTGARPGQLAAARRERIGFVFQDFNLISALTVIENVTLPLDLAGVPARQARKQARAALRAVGMVDRVRSFPDELSGGQRQRVAIARAVVGSRKLLLADEPTGALDSVTGDQVLALLRDRADAGAAVVLVTHDARHAAWADRIVYLADGRIVDHTSASRPEDLLVGGAR